jgi:hypothetical protein
MQDSVERRLTANHERRMRYRRQARGALVVRFPCRLADQQFERNRQPYQKRSSRGWWQRPRRNPGDGGAYDQGWDG